MTDQNPGAGRPRTPVDIAAVKAAEALAYIASIDRNALPLGGKDAARDIKRRTQRPEILAQFFRDIADGARVDPARLGAEWRIAIDDAITSAGDDLTELRRTLREL